MRQKTGPQTSSAEKTIKDIRRATNKLHSSKEKIRIVLEGLRGEDSIAAICRREGIYDASTPQALRHWHARRVKGMPPHVVRESFGPLFVGEDQVGMGQQSEAFCRRLSVPFYHLCRDHVQATRMAPWFSHPKSKVDVWENAGHWIMQDRADDVNAAMLGWIGTL